MIELKNIVKTFGKKVLFDNFSLKIDDGDFVIISGVSGCGKTTLLNIIGSLDTPDSGEVLIDGESIFKGKNRIEFLKKKIGFLFQNFALVENKTVDYNLKLVKNDCRTEVTVEEALETVGMLEKRKQKVYSLSGGEQQRVALARLMLKKCDIILADEPTGSLDRGNAEIVFSILDMLNKQGKTVVVVTHSEELKKRGRTVIEL